MEVPNGENFMIATICTEFFACVGYALAFNLMPEPRSNIRSIP